MGSMGIVYPVVGSSNGTWGTLLNAALALVEDHTHAPGSGQRVPTAGLRINADLAAADAGTSYAITSLKAIDFAPSAAAGMTGYAGALFVSSADNELYYRTTGGTNVKLTSGTTLNVSIVGGIGGDYAASGALLAFVDADDRYTLQQQGSPKPWAGVAIGNLDIYEQAASIVNRVRIKSPAGLAASYDLTLLTALPGSTQVLQVSSTGVISASNIIDVLHINQTVVSEAALGTALVGTWTIGANYNPGSSTISDKWGWRLPLRTGDRVRSIVFHGNRQSTGTLTFALEKRTLSTEIWSTVASGTISTGTGYVNVSVASIDYTLVATESYMLTLTAGGGSIHRADAAVITYDHP